MADEPAPPPANASITKPSKVVSERMSSAYTAGPVPVPLMMVRLESLSRSVNLVFHPPHTVTPSAISTFSL